MLNFYFISLQARYLPLKIRLMRNVALTLLCWVLRAAFALRYRIRIRGLKEIVAEYSKQKDGILFLPNHPAEIDPVILMFDLWPTFKLRPLVVEHFYYLKGFHPLIRFVGALPLPTIES